MKHRSTLRATSGVLPIPIYTHPAKCGGRCIFCPTAKGIPKSYVPNSDTIAARVSGYSPAEQFHRHINRLRNKTLPPGLPLELIILGGSFSALPFDYRKRFVADLYDTVAGCHGSFSCQSPWETGLDRCAVLTVESRPDQIDENECRRLRYLGVTKVEIGIQHVDDAVLRFNLRDHTQQQVLKATRCLKNAGFKVGYHVMIGLPAASFDADIQMVTSTLWQSEYCPDYLKVYPCVLLKDASLQPRLHALLKQGKWSPIHDETAAKIIVALKRAVPPFVRISRIQRQFPDLQVSGGVSAGLRNRIHTTCRCIRCREIGRVLPDASLDPSEPLETRVASVGSDAYIEVVTYDNHLVAIARVTQHQQQLMLREIRVFGTATVVGTSGPWQGQGVGRTLLRFVEGFATCHGMTRVLINSSLGTRSFFRQHGYVQVPDGYLEKQVTSAALPSCGTKRSDVSYVGV